MKKGFTLVEVLTVVLIIAVLTAVAMPQYRRVVERSYATEAVSMLRSLYDSSERLAAEFGARSYPELLEEYDYDHHSVGLEHLDIIPQWDSLQGNDFRCKQTTGFAMVCPSVDPKWIYILYGDGPNGNEMTDNGNFVIAIRAEGKYAGAQLIFDRRDENISCVPSQEDTEDRVCTAYNLDIKNDVPRISKRIFMD